MKNNIVLIGMPGAGKSTVGVVLAKILNLDFIDADLVIQQLNGETLQNLIDSLGSERFIEIENAALLSIEAENTVISTGGSAVYSQEAMEYLKENGIIVYLKVSLEEIERRLEDFSDRGVVMKSGGESSLKQLYEERLPLYEQFADIIVDISDMTITQSARTVAKACSI